MMTLPQFPRDIRAERVFPLATVVRIPLPGSEEFLRKCVLKWRRQHPYVNTSLPAVSQEFLDGREDRYGR